MCLSSVRGEQRKIIKCVRSAFPGNMFRCVDKRHWTVLAVMSLNRCARTQPLLSFDGYVEWFKGEEFYRLIPLHRCRARTKSQGIHGWQLLQPDCQLQTTATPMLQGRKSQHWGRGGEAARQVGFQPFIIRKEHENQSYLNGCLCNRITLGMQFQDVDRSVLRVRAVCQQDHLYK